MTWREFKIFVEFAGVRDDDEIDEIEIKDGALFPKDPPVVTVEANDLVVTVEANDVSPRRFSVKN